MNLPAVIRGLVLLTLIMTSACAVNSSEVMLSERFGICGSLPCGSIFVNSQPGPDFDVGVLKIGETHIDMLLGGHPRFSHRVVKQGVHATEGFRFLGRERSDNMDKLLFAYASGDERGPTYVIFMAPDLGGVEDILLGGKILKACRREGGS